MTPEEEAYYQANIWDLLDQIHKQAEEIKRLEAHSATVLSHCAHLKLSVETLKMQAAYVARLEAAYLDEARENIQATKDFLQEQQTPEEYQAEIDTLARAALERIKNGDE